MCSGEPQGNPDTGATVTTVENPCSTFGGQNVPTNGQRSCLGVCYARFQRRGRPCGPHVVQGRPLRGIFGYGPQRVGRALGQNVVSIYTSVLPSATRLP